MRRRRSFESTFSLFAFQDIITAVTGICLLITMVLALSLITSRRAMSSVTANDNRETLQANIEELEERIALAQRELDQHAKDVRFAPKNSRDLEIEIRTVKIANARIEAKTIDLEQELESLQATTLDGLRGEIREREAALVKRVAENNKTGQQLEGELNHVKQQLSDLKSSVGFLYNPPKDFQKRPWILEVDGRRIVVSAAGEKAPVSELASAVVFVESLRGYDPESDYFVLFAHPGGIADFNDISRELETRGFDFGTDVLGRDQFIIGGQL